MLSDILTLFHPLIARWFTERFGTPTDVQVRAWTEISRGSHVLVTAPTGSGKTLAAFLWGINRLVTGAWPCGETRILYISPLKALNNDVRRNLITPLRELEAVFHSAGVPFPAINVQTRSGDTPGSERQRMLRRPPEILITTPESLNILLTSRSGRHALTGIATVILDEIHAVAGSKRGTHLITGVDRLVPLAGEFQRIALSATVKPLDAISDFVGGFTMSGDEYLKRSVTPVRSDGTKEFSLEIRGSDALPCEPVGDVWRRLAVEFRKIIAGHNSTLFFVNSRRTAERITRLINEEAGEELAYAHHGSLSKELRLAVEEKLKRGGLKAIVATNSLELGIDIGKLDNVVLVQTPRSVSSAIQRIGRSGHGVGEVSRGLLFPTHGMDFVEAAVATRAIEERDLEPLHPVEAPLDLLSQIILSMVLAEEWDLDNLYRFIRASYPYRNLSRKHFDLVVGMLEGKYADSHVPELRPRVHVDRVAHTISGREGVATVVYLEGGTIPDRGYFDLRLSESGAKIGELDEEFVWERKIGETFSLGAQVWQISRITHNAVEVVPAKRTQQIIPFWRGEELDRDFHFSEKIAEFLETWEGMLDSESFVPDASAAFSMDERAAEGLGFFLRRQREATGAPLPHRHHLLIEHYHDPLGGEGAQQVILHTLWGNAVNRPLTFALAAAWEHESGYPLEAFYSNDGIALLLPHEIDPRRLFSLVTPENIEHLLRTTLERTGFFGARFRENAGRALLLAKTNFRKRMPLWLTRLRSKKLLGAVSRYHDFPIVIETWRSCLQDDFDLPALKRLLAELHEGVIAVSETRTTAPSPFAEGLIWQQTNKYIYEDDTPGTGGKTAVGADLIRELIASPHLRPRIPQDLIRLFESKRQRLAEGYAPESTRDLIDWVKERLVLPVDEWERLLAAMSRDHGMPATEIITGVAARIVILNVPGAVTPLITSLDTLPDVLNGLERSLAEVDIWPVVDLPEVQERVREGSATIFRQRDKSENDGEEGASLQRLLSTWLSFRGPVEINSLERSLALPADLLAQALAGLEEAGLVITDLISEGSPAPEICDAANLETLLRILRRSRQPSFEAVDLRHLPLFLAAFQGLTERGYTLDDLRGRLEQLFGLPMPAAAWEEEILPARLNSYATSWLDSIMQTSDLGWFGCGDKRIAFSFPEDIDLFLDTEEPGSKGRAEQLIPDRQGRYTVTTIAMQGDLPLNDVIKELWQAAWQGEATTDSFVSVRQGIQNRFEHAPHEEAVSMRRMANRWKTSLATGSWYLLPHRPAETDPLAEEEMNKERVRVLLDRYGIIFRELLWRELPPLQWHQIFRTLRIMELSGEILSGSFFLGIPGLQFISHEAFRLLSKGMTEESIYWMNATDPASLCGTGLEGLKDELPTRLMSSHLVYHGSRLVVVSRRFGKELDIKVADDNPHLHSYLDFFNMLVSREFNPRKSVTVEMINGVPAVKSAYHEALKNFGFVEAYKGMELWRRY